MASSNIEEEKKEAGQAPQEAYRNQDQDFVNPQNVNDRHFHDDDHEMIERNARNGEQRARSKGKMNAINRNLPNLDL